MILKDHVTPNTGAIADENSAMPLYFKNKNFGKLQITFLTCIKIEMIVNYNNISQ